MKEFYHTVKSPVGLPPRVGGIMMQLVRDFDSSVILTNGDKSGDLKRLLGILHMDIRCGDRLHVQVAGRDEEIACQELREFMEQNL